MGEDTKTLVTIVIPAYNGGRYIREAIDSVLAQDYPNIELVVLDDGSTDNTAEILNIYGKQFYWDRHENMGQAATLNRGWGMAHGEIFGYLSADDVLMPKAITTSVNILKKFESVVLTYGDFNLIDPQSRIIRRVRNADFNYLDMVANLNCQPGPGILFRRQAFEAVGGWNSTYRQMPDYEYWLRLGLVGGFFHIPDVLASFRIHNDSQTFAKGDPQKADEPVRIITEYFKNQPRLPKSIKAVRNRSLSSAQLMSAQLHLRAGRYSTGLGRLKTALRLYPENVLNVKSVRMLFNALFNRTGHRILWHLKHLLAKYIRVGP